MSERKPSFYLIKKDGRYYNLAAGHWEHDREYATRYINPPLNISGKLVPVYVTVKKIKKGHSWSWARKRLLEGKKVRRQGFKQEGRYISLQAGYVTWDNGSASLPVGLFYATDWELYNE